MEEVQALLAHSREQAASNDPNGALASLLAAVQITHGEEGVSKVISSMKQLQQDQEHEQMRQEQEQDPLAAAYASLDALIHDSSTLLYQKGKEGILAAAFKDGSSVICKHCGALVARDRWKYHPTWCDAAPSRSRQRASTWRRFCALFRTNH